LSEAIACSKFEQAFDGLYSEAGRPALPVRRMEGFGYLSIYVI
jgi:hypothetical protein